MASSPCCPDWCVHVSVLQGCVSLSWVVSVTWRDDRNAPTGLLPWMSDKWLWGRPGDLYFNQFTCRSGQLVLLTQGTHFENHWSTFINPCNKSHHYLHFTAEKAAHRGFSQLIHLPTGVGLPLKQICAFAKCATWHKWHLSSAQVAQHRVSPQFLERPLQASCWSYTLEMTWCFPTVLISGAEHALELRW
jgi:hypothetical protein